MYCCAQFVVLAVDDERRGVAIEKKKRTGQKIKGPWEGFRIGGSGEELRGMVWDDVGEAVAETASMLESVEGKVGGVKAPAGVRGGETLVTGDPGSLC